MDNLQTASTVVDASARIYSFRVDAVHYDVLKMAGGLSKAAQVCLSIIFFVSLECPAACERPLPYLSRLSFSAPSCPCCPGHDVHSLAHIQIIIINHLFT